VTVKPFDWSVIHTTTILMIYLPCYYSALCTCIRIISRCTYYILKSILAVWNRLFIVIKLLLVGTYFYCVQVICLQFLKVTIYHREANYYTHSAIRKWLTEPRVNKILLGNPCNVPAWDQNYNIYIYISDKIEK